MKIIENRPLRTAVFLLGIFSGLLGFVGLFVPLLPTTPFLLLAAWCFMRSSLKAHAWLYANRYVGPSLQRWDERRAIAPGAKMTAIAMILVSLIVMWMKVSHLPLKAVVTLMLVGVTAFILSRPS